MTHITELSIHNFRAIRELSYFPRQINILTGRNNAGKTTVLDAIALNVLTSDFSDSDNAFIGNSVEFITVGQKSAQIISNINSVNIESDSNELKKKYGDFISNFFENDFQNLKTILSKSKVRSIIDNKEFKREYIDFINEFFEFMIISSDYNLCVCQFYKQKVVSGNQDRDFSKRINSEFKKIIKKYSEIATSPKGVKLDSAFNHIGFIPGKLMFIIKPNDQPKKIVRLNHYNKLVFDDISEEELVVLTEFIMENNIVKNLKRLSQTDVVYQRDNSLITIPISAHGDGFKSLLNTIRYLVKAKDSILLIEEPENHLHPRYVDIFIENLFEYSKKLNVQVFISTHSLDLIRSALKYPETDEEKAMLLISKMTSDGQNVEKFDYTVDEGLKVIDELYQDLRGN